MKAFWLWLTWNFIGQPRREEAERVARGRLLVREMIAPKAKARILQRWAEASKPRLVRSKA